MAKSKIRYIKQVDRTSCGPVALINVLKWLGCDVSYNNFIYMSKCICDWKDPRYEEDGGVVNDGMDKALNYFKINFKAIDNPKLSDFDTHLENGGAILISYIPILNSKKHEQCGHISFCIGKSSKMYVMVNDCFNKTIIKRHARTIERILKSKIDDADFKVWLISR